MRYSLTGLLLVSRGGAQESFTVREEKLITSGLPGVLGTSEIVKILVFIISVIYAENHCSLAHRIVLIYQSETRKGIET